MLYPVTIDVLNQIFSRYGPVSKIVTFSKNGGFQAFVQYAYHTAAANAKTALDGQHIYVGGCTLRIHFSTTRDLDVKYNNEKSRDFTNPYLPPGPASANAPPEAPNSYPQMGSHYGDGNTAMGYPPQGYPPQGYPPAAPNAAYGMPNAAKSGMGSQTQGTSPVVIVSGLNEEKVTPDAIFTLFGVYGDVLKVKILFTKKDTALVQMNTPQQAEAVVANLSGCPIFGKPIRVNFSKHSTIMIPSSNPNDENPSLTKEYVGSPFHRFKSPSKTFKHVTPPAATLHVSSVPASVDEERLRATFLECGEVVNIKFFPSEKRMALVQMGSIGDATTALITFHNYRFEEGAIPIRISFAKSAIYT